MSWDFATDPAFAERLAWVDYFVREEVEPLDFVVANPRGGAFVVMQTRMGHARLALATAMCHAVADGPSEVHKVTLARQELSRYSPHPGFFPNFHIPTLREQARQRYADVLARHAQRER